MQLSEKSAPLAADDDVFTRIGWRSVKVRGLAELGELAAAAAISQEVIDLTMGTDGPNAQGEALLDHAELLACAGDSAGAAALAEDAAARFAAKESRVALQQVMLFLYDLQP